MREISPAVNLSADEFLRLAPPEMQELITRIRNEKAAGTRPKPSASFIDHSLMLTEAQRRSILNMVASLVDENLSGRSEMCIQFADLLSRVLAHLQLPARPVLGTAIYYDNKGREIFRWKHAWVRVGEEVIDGNVDCLSENPTVPCSVKVAPYWGPIRDTPTDRKLREEHGARLDPDSDVDDTWWPELLRWLDQTQ